MYLSEEKRAEIRKCIENQRSNSGVNPGVNNKNYINGYHNTTEMRKISHILFDDGDGKEVLIPF